MVLLRVCFNFVLCTRGAVGGWASADLREKNRTGVPMPCDAVEVARTWWRREVPCACANIFWVCRARCVDGLSVLPRTQWLGLDVDGDGEYAWFLLKGAG